MSQQPCLLCPSDPRAAHPSLQLSAPHTQHLLPGLSPRAPSQLLNHPWLPSSTPSGQQVLSIHASIHALRVPFSQAQSSAGDPLASPGQQPRGSHFDPRPPPSSTGRQSSPNAPRPGHLPSPKPGRPIRTDSKSISGAGTVLPAPSPAVHLQPPLPLSAPDVSPHPQSHHWMLSPTPRAPQGACLAASLPKALPRASWPSPPQHPPQATFTQLFILLFSVPALGCTRRPRPNRPCQPYFIWKRCLWNWDQSKNLATGRPFWTIQLARDAKCVPEGGTQGRFAATEGKGR